MPRSSAGDSATPSRIARWYSLLAIITLNTIILFVVVNLALAVYYWAQDRKARWDLDYDQERLAKVYPGWSREQVRAFQDEWGWQNEYEPFTMYRPPAVTRPHVNVSKDGFRMVKNQGPWPPNPAAFTVFMFGGSTTFGSGLPDDQTIPSFLQEAMAGSGCGQPAQVYNFAREGFFSTQERILFEQLLVAGHAPRMAIFLDGLNDFYSADGAPEGVGVLPQSTVASAVQKLPVLRAARQLRRQSGAAPGSQAPSGSATSGYDDEKTLRQVIERWLANRKLVEAASRMFAVQPLFVWQPAATYMYDLKLLLFYPGNFSYFGRHQRSRYGYAMMDRLRRETDLGKDFLWLANLHTGRSEHLYVDALHYTASFSREIAAAILDYAKREGLLACDGVKSGRL